MRHLVVFERAGDGSWGAAVPDLPGCYSGGATLEEAREQVKEAIQAHVDLASDAGGIDGPGARDRFLFEIIDV